LPASRFGSPRPRVIGALLAAGALAGATTPATLAGAQTVRPGLAPAPFVVTVEGAAVDTGTLRLLHDLARIESDVRLGLLFAPDHAGGPAGSHLSDRLAQTWPAVRPAPGGAAPARRGGRAG